MKVTDMSDSKTKGGPSDGDRINPKEEFELAGWARRLGTTPALLKKTVKKVGTLVSDVKKELAAPTA